MAGFLGKSMPEEAGRGVRVTVERTFDLGSWRETDRPRVVRIEGDDLDADRLRGAISSAKREAGIPRARPDDDRERLDQLAAFVEEHGSGESARRRWNDAHEAAEHYATRSSFHHAVERALDAPERRVRRLLGQAAEDAAAMGERDAATPFSEVLRAAEGR